MKTNPYRRYEALQELAEAFGDALVVCNLGHPAQELFRIRDRAQNFYMLGSMGLATSVALGVALSTARPVVAIDGDASVTMNMGAFATLGHLRPGNLVQIIIDNAANGSTGFQPSFTAGRLRLDAVARAAGIDSVRTVERPGEARQALADAFGTVGPHVIVVRTAVGMPDGVGVIPLSKAHIRTRFEGAIRAA